MQIHPAPPDRWLSFGLAFVGGYGDAVSFILAKTFTGHVTGSLVLAAVSIAARDWRVSIARVSCSMFLVGDSRELGDRAAARYAAIVASTSYRLGDGNHSHSSGLHGIWQFLSQRESKYLWSACR